MNPTFEGFQAWVVAIMGVPANVMPDTATLQYAYDEACNIVLCLLNLVPCQPTSPTLYAIAIYNLAGDFLVRVAQDPTNPPASPPPPNAATFWGDLRTKFNMGSFSPGLISSAADQGTSESMTIPDQLQGLTLGDLATLKTPWGQQYMALASYWGTIWGLTV
jgi:hypothetical protein